MEAALDSVVKQAVKRRHTLPHTIFGSMRSDSSSGGQAMVEGKDRDRSSIPYLNISEHRPTCIQVGLFVRCAMLWRCAAR